MNPSVQNSPAFLIGMVIGALVAGGLCGLLPLSIGMARKRTDWALGGLMCCLGAGLFAGLLLAVPVAIVYTIVMVSVVGKAREPVDTWQAWIPPPALPVEEPAKGKVARGAAAPGIQCASCAASVPALNGHLPPWCPGCGAYLKPAQPANGPSSPARV